MSAQPVFKVESAHGSEATTFHACAVTDDRSAVLRVLTEEAVGYFGRDRLMVSNVRLATSVSAPGTVTYLATGDFEIVG